MPAAYSGDFGVTPGRQSYAIFDVPDVHKRRDPWYMTRQAEEMSRGVDFAAVLAAAPLALFPSRCWGLLPMQLAFSVELTPPGASPGFSLTDLLVPLALSVIVYQQRKTLTGTVAAPSVAASGDNFLIKRIDDGQAWNHEILSAAMANDAATFGKVPYDTQNYRMARSLVSAGIGGTGSYPANKAYSLRFTAPGTMQHAPDNVLGFYFGGSLNPYGAGNYCLTLKGSGMADLWEKDSRVSGGWRRLMTNIRYAPPGRVAGLAHSILIVPHGNDSIDFIFGAAAALPRRGFTGATTPHPTGQDAHSVVYRIDPAKAGHGLFASVTGRGQVRMDLREDLHFPFQPARVIYPASGTLRDDPFTIPQETPPTTPMTVLYKADKPDGTTLAPAVKYHDTAGAEHACPVNGDGSFQVVAGVFDYFVDWTFTTVDGEASPFLYYYSVNIPGELEQVVPTPVMGGNLGHVAVQVQDLDPERDACTLAISDPGNQLTILSVKDEGRFQLRVKYDPSDTTKETILFDGMWQQPKADAQAAEDNARFVYNPTNSSSKAFPKTDAPWPKAGWKLRMVSGVGMYSRARRAVLQERQLLVGPEAFTGGGTGGVGPPTVTSAIKTEMLRRFYPWQIDCPDLPDRMWVSGGSPDEYTFEPGLSEIEIATRLARLYLGLHCIWDANALSPTAPGGAPRGMWRFLQPPPQGGAAVPVWTFTTKPQAWTQPHPVTSPYSYPPRTTFCERVSAFTQAPEGNNVWVVVGNNIAVDNPANNVIKSQLFNPNSFTVPGFAPPNPAHPDYLGEEIRRVFPFPLLAAASWLDGSFVFNTDATKAAADAICARLFNMIAFGRKFLLIRAPFVLIDDPDPFYGGRKRPLRVYDTIYLDNHKALIRTVTPAWDSDAEQFADYRIMLCDPTITDYDA